MNRTVACLFLLAAFAVAQESQPILLALGGELQDYRVTADLSRVDHSSAEGLARSYTRFYLDQLETVRRFESAFAQEHLAILKRCFDSKLVDKQRAVYDERESKSKMAKFVVSKVTADGDAKAVAELLRSWRDPKTDEIIERRMQLQMARRGSLWWAMQLLEAQPDGGYAVRQIDFPPAYPAPEVPAAPKADRASPEACASMLKEEMRRLSALTDRARREMYRHHPMVLGALFGEDAAKEAEARRKAFQPRDRVLYRVEAPSELGKGVYAVAVTALEEVKDDPGATSPVGQVLFKLRKTDDGWRIFSEAIRPTIDKAHAPITHNFAIFFLQ